jgi:cytochrome b
MATSTTSKTSIMVWDAPTRVFHWLMVFCFAGAYMSSESDSLLDLHFALGYTMAGLVAFRVVWGLIGTRYARFTSFVRGPGTTLRYVGSMLSHKAERPVGHNPLGALSIVLMLLSTLVIVYTGWVCFNGGARSLKELHEGASDFMLAVVAVHVAGVVFASMMQRENLAMAMLHGYKQGRSTDSIRWSCWPLAVLLLTGVLGFWFLQWQGPPTRAAADSGYQNSGSGERRHGGDDD